jgi:membrane-bound serine protease (ClpP class)
VAGIGLIVASLFLSLVGSFPTHAALRAAGYTLVSSLVLTTAFGLVVARAFPRTSMFRKLTLSEAEHAGRGYVSAALPQTLVGKIGQAVSTLRPSGKADIEGARLDVVTEGDYISEGAAVVVIQVEGSRVVVREVT